MNLGAGVSGCSEVILFEQKVPISGKSMTLEQDRAGDAMHVPMIMGSDVGFCSF